MGGGVFKVHVMKHREHDKETTDTLAFQSARPDFTMPKYCSQPNETYVFQSIPIGKLHRSLSSG